MQSETIAVACLDHREDVAVSEDERSALCQGK